MRSILAVLSILGTVAVGAQTSPRWDVGAIRRNVSGSAVATLNTRGEKLVAVNTTAEMLIRSGYAFESYRIFGAPGWWSVDRFDVAAVATGPATPEQARVMMQQLLAEHFKLAAHVETREISSYRLVLARSDGRLGPSLTPVSDDCDALRAAGTLASAPPPTSIEDFAAVRQCTTSQGPGIFSAGVQKLDGLVRALGGELRGPVIDRTGLTGNFNIVLRWNPDPTQTGVDAKFPSLLTAIQEQLGLKLEAGRDPMEVLVIDRLERPVTD